MVLLYIVHFAIIKIIRHPMLITDVNFVSHNKISFSVAANRIRDMLYTPLDSSAACFRRHNGTHQFGCSCMYINLMTNLKNILLKKIFYYS